MLANTDKQNLKVSTRAMYDEFRRQGVPVKILDSSSSMLEYQDVRGAARMLFSTSSDKGSAAGAAIARSKIRTAIIAKSLGIRTPAALVCSSYEQAQSFMKKHSRVVLKPVASSGGSGVTTGVTSPRQLEAAYLYANSFSDQVIIQEHVDGDDMRLLIVAGEFCSAVERTPAHITGDGITSVLGLIDIENDSKRRGDKKHMSTMDPISLPGAKRYLSTNTGRIPEQGQVVRVMGPANLSLGGTASEATHLVTEEMIADAEKIAQKLKLGICGVDMMVNSKTGAYTLIEVNATPGVNMHNDKFWGTSSDVVEKYVKWLVA